MSIMHACTCTLVALPLSRSCSKGGRSGGMENCPVEIAANNLYTFSPSNGNFPVVKWNLPMSENKCHGQNHT